jgi:hypothetical protein
MHVSIAVILTMASQSALKPINQSRINRAKSEFSRFGGGCGGRGGRGGRDGRDGRGNGCGSGRGQSDGDKLTHKGNGKAMVRLSMQSPLLVALENMRASGA